MLPNCRGVATLNTVSCGRRNSRQCNYSPTTKVSRGLIDLALALLFFFFFFFLNCAWDEGVLGLRTEDTHKNQERKEEKRKTAAAAACSNTITTTTQDL